MLFIVQKKDIMFKTQKRIHSTPCLRQNYRKTYPGWPHILIEPYKGVLPPRGNSLMCIKVTSCSEQLLKFWPSSPEFNQYSHGQGAIICCWKKYPSGYTYASCWIFFISERKTSFNSRFVPFTGFLNFLWEKKKQKT